MFWLYYLITWYVIVTITYFILKKVHKDQARRREREAETSRRDEAEDADDDIYNFMQEAEETTRRLNESLGIPYPSFRPGAGDMYRSTTTTLTFKDRPKKKPAKKKVAKKKTKTPKVKEEKKVVSNTIKVEDIF